MDSFHLVKATLAKKLSEELPAVVFNMDVMIAGLYGKELNEAEFFDKLKIVDKFMWDYVAQIIKCGTDVIIDQGPWSKIARKNIFDKAISITDNVVFHSIILDPNIARERLIKRNKENPEQGLCHTDFFDKNLSQYEPITKDEGYNVKYYFNNSKLELLK